jgi:hypothetical protein
MTPADKAYHFADELRSKRSLAAALRPAHEYEGHPVDVSTSGSTCQCI